MRLIDSIVAQAGAIAAIRQDIHAHPELCYEELRTASVIARTLERWGIPYHSGIGQTGIVAVIEGKPAQRSVGLRADMDALPMQESNTFAHASQVAGKMHGCGHDGHVAMLLAACQHLAATRNFCGTVYAIFQPAEEGGGGAKAMLEDGLLTRFPMEAVFGMHNWPELPAGQFALSPGPVMASSNEFTITVQGKGGHAALAYLAVDPVVIAAHIVTALQTIASRNIKAVDPVVVSVTTIHAGEATNVIANQCVMTGTVRTFATSVLDEVEGRMQLICAQTAAAFGASAHMEFVRNYPPTINHPSETAFARAVLSDLVGAEQLLVQEPSMGAEDFAYMLLAAPGCYCYIGNGGGAHRHAGHGLGPCTLHNASYDFNDAITPVGASYWVRLAEAWLKTPSR